MRSKKPRSLEALCLVNGKPGQHFFTEKSDKDMTAISTYYQVKIKTERLVTVTTGTTEPKAGNIVKVTIL